MSLNFNHPVGAGGSDLAAVNISSFMKIWHVGAEASPLEVNGVNYVIWELAKAQAAAGNDVSIVLGGQPGKSAAAFARETGVRLLEAPAGFKKYGYRVLSKLLQHERPQIVHFHSVFIPWQARFASFLSSIDIPFVVTPHGGFSAKILARNALKKKVYGRFVEGPRLGKAAAIIAVSEDEESEIKSYAPDATAQVRYIPNPVDCSSLQKTRWKGPSNRNNIVYLGRLDVEHKGIDRILEIARLMPDAVFDLYGSEDGRTRNRLEELKSVRTDNVHFHSPVFGAEKLGVLSNASLYIQASRWEVFGISVVEAMILGLPCAIADTMSMARLFDAHGLGITFNDDVRRTTSLLRNVLHDMVKLNTFSSRAETFARANFAPEVVARRHLDLYGKVLQRPLYAEARASARA